MSVYSEQINNPSTLYPSAPPQEAIEIQQECAICMEEDIPVAERVTLACNHIFHKTCVEGWVSKENNERRTARCPLCRREIFQIERDQKAIEPSSKEKGTFAAKPSKPLKEDSLFPAVDKYPPSYNPDSSPNSKDLFSLPLVPAHVFPDPITVRTAAATMETEIEKPFPPVFFDSFPQNSIPPTYDQSVKASNSVSPPSPSPSLRALIVELAKKIYAFFFQIGLVCIQRAISFMNYLSSLLPSKQRFSQEFSTQKQP